MKRNVNVFIGVVLCAVLCGTFVWLRSAGEEDTWKPNEIYNEVHTSSFSASYTNATTSAPSYDGGVALSMSSSSLSRKANYYAGASYAPLASSSFASSPMVGASGAGLYTTSSAEMKSFGGGGNGGVAMGGRSSMSGGSSSMAGGAGVGSLSISSPIAYSTARSGNMGGLSGGADMLAQQGAMPDMASSFGYAAASNYLNAGTYDQYNAMYGGSSTGRSNVRGKQNSGVTDSWLDWLYRYGWKYGTGTGSDETGWTYTYTEEQLRQAYEDYITNYWDPMWHPGASKPTFEQWLAWLYEGDGAGHFYNGNWYVPVGDMLPLFILALLYAVVMFVRKKTARELNS